MMTQITQSLAVKGTHWIFISICTRVPPVPSVVGMAHTILAHHVGSAVFPVVGSHSRRNFQIHVLSI